MQIILNYKSYYEAFKIGVIDNGFTAVARVLFYPIFKNHTVCDENGTPYEADNTYSSRWGNGQIPIQIEIQQAASDNAMLQAMIEHFNNKVVPYELSDALKDEMQNTTCFSWKMGNRYAAIPALEILRSSISRTSA